MGCCMSSPPALAPPPAAYVVSPNGELHQYPIPITVSRVLCNSQQNITSSAFFLCHSDSLFLDDYIPALHPDHLLYPAQIYFLLPSSKLHYRLTASDMAALAVKAALALRLDNTTERKNKARVSPLLLPNREEHHRNDYSTIKLQPTSRSGSGLSTSASVRKLQRFSSRKAKMAVRSFRMRLTTIYEGSSLHF